MKKFSKLVLALIAVAGIAFTAGCKSDCEKAYENGLAAIKDDAQKKAYEEGKKASIETCSKYAPEVQKCLAGAADGAAAAKCVTDAAKKEEKK